MGLPASNRVKKLRTLAIWLYLVGGIQASAVVAVFMPHGWMDACGMLMGVQSLPETPLSGYLARLSSAMYVVHGLTLWVIAFQLPRSLFIVRPVAWLTLLLSILMLYIDLVEKMPKWWTVIEVSALVVNAVVSFSLASPGDHGQASDRQLDNEV